MSDFDVSRLLAADAAVLSHAERIDLLVGLQAARDLVDAAELRALAVLAQADRGEKQWVREEVACALSIAPATAAGRLHEAVDLVELLPATVAAVDAGTVTPRQARALLELTRGLAGEVRESVEARVLPRAAGRTAAEFRRAVRRAVAAVDPRGLEERHAVAVLDRRVVLRPAEDGMSEVWALLPADGAAALMAALHALAGGPTVGDDGRTADQRRADALVALAEGSALAAGPAGASGVPSRISVHVTVPLSTLLGGDGAGELAGHGPVPASLARRLATSRHAVWRRIVTDAAGRPVNASRTYRPPAALAELVRARDGTCRFPGCSRPARSTEIDHLTACENGGATVADNLHCLCSRHHHLKHEAGWRVHREPDGTTRWRTPTGRRYGTPPEDDIGTYSDPQHHVPDPGPEHVPGDPTCPEIDGAVPPSGEPGREADAA